MRLADYPDQEPFSEFGIAYRDACMALSESLEGPEHSFGESASQSLMVFPAEKPGGPVLLFVHGGGWTNGYKEEMAFLAPGLNDSGITLVSAGYRLAPENVFPANISDIKTAIMELVQLAPLYGYDGSNLFVGGHSAGGHLTSLAALDPSWLKSVGLPTGTIKGCLPISGVYDFTPGNGMSVRPRFLGEADATTDVDASPIFNITEAACPLLIAYGSNDFPHLMMQAEKLRTLLAARGIEHERIILDGCDHITSVTSAAAQESLWMARATAWIMSRVAG